MKKNRCTEEKIIEVLKQLEAGRKVSEVLDALLLGRTAVAGLVLEGGGPVFKELFCRR